MSETNAADPPHAAAAPVVPANSMPPGQPSLVQIQVTVEGEEADSFREVFNHRDWKDYINDLKQESKLDYEKVGKATLIVGGQAAGGILTHAFANPLSPSWAANFVEFAAFGGLGLTVVGITLRHFKRKLLSSMMIKAGAIATASSVIGSVAMALPPLWGWTLGTCFEALVVWAVAVA